MKQKTPFFHKNFPVVKNNDELFAVQDEQPELDRAYVAAACIPERKKWIEYLWERYWPYADKNFLIEVRTVDKFNERTWEMYLGCVFLSKNYKISNDVSSGPDFTITLGDRNVRVEATAPNRGEVDSPLPRAVLEPGVMYSGGGNIEQISRTKILRFTAGFIEKERKFHEYLKQGIVKEDECYIIAINAHNFSGLVEDIDYYTRRVFLGMGCLSYTLGADGTLSTQPSAVPQPFVEKRTTAGIEKIPTDYFLTDKYSHISAVLLCGDHIVQSPKDWELMGQNITILRNHYATNKLPNEFGLFAREWEFDGKNLTLIRD
jgi:hypothetical protein